MVMSLSGISPNALSYCQSPKGAYHTRARCKYRTYPPASAEEESKTEHPGNEIATTANQSIHLFYIQLVPNVI